MGKGIEGMEGAARAVGSICEASQAKHDTGLKRLSALTAKRSRLGGMRPGS